MTVSGWGLPLLFFLLHSFCKAGQMYSLTGDSDQIFAEVLDTIQHIQNVLKYN